MTNGYSGEPGQDTPRINIMKHRKRSKMRKTGLLGDTLIVLALVSTGAPLHAD